MRPRSGRRSSLRLTVMLAGAALLSSCTVAREVSPLAAESPLRVALLLDSREVRVGGESRVAVEGATRFLLDPGQEAHVIQQGEKVRVRGRAGSESDRMSFRSPDHAGFIIVNGRRYRGWVEILARRGALLAVNVVGAESYLRGVVTAEMGPRPHDEWAALQAQAIVSRTYALKNRGRYLADGYDIRAGVADQAYVGVEGETPAGARAVRETAGLVVTYRGQLIDAFFHSTCGYSTASPGEAFRTVQPVPYLTPVSDRRPDGGYYGDLSPRFRWVVEWEGSELRDILRRTVPGVLGVDAELLDEVRDVQVRRRGPSGRVTEVRIQVGRGEIPVFAPDIRQVLLTPEGRPLASTAFELAVTRSHGSIQRLRATGVGWGHGVGMCQWGAIGRARAGQTARTILTTYFPGTRIERWY